MLDSLSLGVRLWIAAPIWITTPWIVIETDLCTLTNRTFTKEWIYSGAHEGICRSATGVPNGITLYISPTNRLTHHLLCLHD
jgi:hypothetical protein